MFRSRWARLTLLVGPALARDVYRSERLCVNVSEVAFGPRVAGLDLVLLGGLRPVHRERDRRERALDLRRREHTQADAAAEHEGLGKQDERAHGAVDDRRTGRTPGARLEAFAIMGPPVSTSAFGILPWIVP